jgi:hypothetical protein
VKNEILVKYAIEGICCRVRHFISNRPGGLLATFLLISLELFQYLPNHPVPAALRPRLDGSRSVSDVEVFVSALDGTRELPSSCCCNRLYFDIHERRAYDRKRHQESGIFVSGRFADGPFLTPVKSMHCSGILVENFCSASGPGGMALDLDAASRA